MAPGLDVRISSVGLATLKSEQAGPYAFNMAFDINGVAFGSTARSMESAAQRPQRQRRVAKDPVPADGRRHLRQRPTARPTGTPWVSVTGPSDAAEAVNSLVAGLTPANVLESLQFPISSRPSAPMPTARDSRR